jgi:endonuclease YncB( thermonuclease family)
MRFAYVLALGLLAAQPVAAEEVTGVPRIVDADTVYVAGTKIRLSGVDAPETDQICLAAEGQRWTCGIEATTRLRAFSAGRAWTCQLSGTDRCGRNLGACQVAGEDVSRWLARNGWALAFRRYSMAYIADEDWARTQKQGLWAGTFIAPWDWRHRGPHTVILGAVTVPTDAQRKLVLPGGSTEAPSSDCVIKGNLRAQGGECIYHVPGGQFYDRLKMKPPEGRRWFCTEAEAQAAGCRRSKL